MSRYVLKDNVIVVTLMLVVLFLSVFANNFLTIGNAKNVAINSAILSVVVVPGTLLIVSGYIDLSVGSVTGFSGVLTALAASKWGWSAPASMFVGLVSGAGIGAANGLLCCFSGFNSIVVTLGMLSVVRGATLMITSASLFGLGDAFAIIGRGTVLGVPIVVIIAVTIFILGGVFFRATPWGRYVYAIGANREAAYLAGLPVRRLPFALYVMTGLAAGVAGIMSVSRLDGAAPAQLGINLELASLTAVLVGGVAFAGGRGSLSGVFFAVLLLGVLQNGLVLMNVPTFTQTLAQGLLLITAATIDGTWSKLEDLSSARRWKLGWGGAGSGTTVTRSGANPT
jgi:ribose/xylose/arabinose/galactoside ABC-type transport system permease subunit